MAYKDKKKKQSKPTKKSPRPAAKGHDDDYSAVRSPLFIHGVVWTVLLIFTTIFMYISSDALLAVLIRSMFGGLFGLMAYVIPMIFAGTLFYLVYTKDLKRMWIKFTLSLLALADLSAFIELFAQHKLSEAYYVCSETVSGGGLIGAAFSAATAALVTKVGAFVVFMILFVVLVCVIAHFNIIPHIVNGVKKLCGISVDMGDKVKKKTDEYAARRREIRENEERLAKALEENEQGLKIKPLEHIEPIDMELPESLNSRLKKKPAQSELNDITRTKVKSIDIANGFSDDVELNRAMPSPDMFGDEFSENNIYDDMIDDDYGTAKADNGQEDIVPLKEGYKTESCKTQINKSDSDTNPPMDDLHDEEVIIPEDIPINTMEEKKKPKEKNLTDTEKMNFRDEINNALAVEPEPYHYPTLDLLDPPKQSASDHRQDLYKRAERLIAVLDNFGVKAKPVQVTQGPTVTRYEILPSSGTKLSKIVGLADDIALNLAVSTVLIAPVPGKAGTVGVEIPNSHVATVTIREMLASPEFRNAKSKLTVCLGKDIGGNVVVGDISKWPHALIAGATGSGKSVCINTIVTSILYKADPNEVKLIMVDPKQVELGVYNGIPHLLIPVVTDAKKAAGALNWAVSEMMNRYEKFKESGVRKLEMYNRLMEKSGGEKMPQIVIIIDELADLMMVAAKEVEAYICRLAQLARAAGIYLIIATQRPSVDVITGLIKANIPSRIAFFVSSQVDSRTVIDKAGAEKLLGNGDMLYFPTGARSTARVQGAFVSDGEVERIVEYIKDTSPETHYREDLEEHIERIELGENGVTPDKEEDGDPLLNDAVQLAIELGKISTSMVQRRLSVGYSRAGRLVDQMEARGIIGPANGSKPREVLVCASDMMFVSGDKSNE